MAKTYYVSAKNGNDKNPGTDKKPLKTIQSGVNKLSAGDTLIVQEGTYSEQVVINRSGDSRNPIVIRAAQNQRPLIDGSGIRIKNTARLVSIVRCQYVTFSGFDVQDSRGRGIGIDTCSHIVISDCQVQKCITNGIFAVDTDHLTIEQCRVHSCAQRFVSSSHYTESVALLLKRCSTATVQNNQCYENSAEGIGAFYTRASAIRKNTSYDNRHSQIKFSSVQDLVVDSNFCYHTGRQQYLHLNGGRPPGIVKSDRKNYPDSGVWHTRNIMVSNNIVAGCGAGFQCTQNGGALTSINLVHNTFVNSTDTAIQIDSRQSHSGSVLENNLAATTNGGNMARVASPGGLLWRHNFWSQFPTDDTFNPANDIVNPNTGLRDINAPIVAGQATTAPYELTAVSPAVNEGIRSEVVIDFYGRARDVNPDLGAHEIDNTGGSGPDEGELPPPGERVTDGLLVLYDFSAGWGNIVADSSGVGTALDLTIGNTAAVQWANQGLIIKTPTTISSSGPATKVIEACRASNEITIEAWVTPATTQQGGPARIVSISNDTNTRNVTLAQGLKNGEPTALYNTRLRTTNSDDNGIPSISTPNNSLQTELTHVVFTRTKDGRAILFMNGQERAIDTLAGSLSNWATSYRLLLANERTGDRPWLGTYTLVAAYGRALTSAEVQHNYSAGLPVVSPLEAEFSAPLGQHIGLVPHTVDFNSSDSYSVNGITAYAWNFGDNTQSTEANPTHTYTKTGTYTVSLTVTDQQGLIDTVSKTNYITVTDSALPALPGDYARFVVANLAESRVLGFGIQYPDFRCILAWNEDPYQIMIYRSVEDILERYEVPGTIELIWVDNPEEDTEDE